MKQKFLCFFLVLLLVNITVKSSEAIAPAIAIPAVAIGTALLATSAGTYYATSDDPVVVKGKQIFQKAHLAKKIGLDLGSDVLGDLMADGGGFYAGVPAYIGAGIKDIADYVQQSGSNAYDYWSGLIDDYITRSFPSDSSNEFLYSGTDGQLRKFFLTPLGNSDFLSSSVSGVLSESGCSNYLFSYNGASYYVNSSGRSMIGVKSSGKWVLGYHVSSISSGGEPTPLPPLAIDYSGVASAINPAEAKDETEKILSQLPPTALTASSATDVAGIGGQNDAPPALSHSQLQSVLGQMQSDIAGNASDNIGHIASSNPTDVNAQIEAEKAQAEAEQKALEEAQEALETPAAVPSAPEWGELNLTPFLELKDSLLTNAPFSWIAGLGNVWDVLVADPTPPSIEISLGIVDFDLDFSPFNDVAGFIRSVMSFLILIATCWLIINLYRN